MRQWAYEWAKRGVDLVGSSLALLVLLPGLPLVALAIRLDSRGPVFYGAPRVGRHGRPFLMWKFRTMVADADHRPGAINVSDHDGRVTRVGLLLRRSKVNELPQFLNVLTGEMSLVGPRPEVEHYVRQFTDEEREILTVRPGLIDWATLRFSDMGTLLASSEDPDHVYETQVRPQVLCAQLAYVRTRGFRQDMRILMSGLRQLFFLPVARRFSHVASLLGISRAGRPPVDSDLREG